MTPQTDIFGNTPKIGDTIVWNPVKYKGLVYGICKGFSKSSGLPVVEMDRSRFQGYYGARTAEGYHTPKTGFIIKGA